MAGSLSEMASLQCGMILLASLGKIAFCFSLLGEGETASQCQEQQPAWVKIFFCPCQGEKCFCAPSYSQQQGSPLVCLQAIIPNTGASDPRVFCP